jgi:hypothetical protein
MVGRLAAARGIKNRPLEADLPVAVYIFLGSDARRDFPAVGVAEKYLFGHPSLVFANLFFMAKLLMFVPAALFLVESVIFVNFYGAVFDRKIFFI